MPKSLIALRSGSCCDAEWRPTVLGRRKFLAGIASLSGTAALAGPAAMGAKRE
jgi:hypothetical protein